MTGSISFPPSPIIRRCLTHIPCICSIGRVTKFVLFPFTIFYLILFSAYGFAERPFLVTESAIPTKRGSYRLEGGLSFSRFSANKNDTVFKGNLRYGLIQNLEFDLEVPYLFIETDNNHRNRQGDFLLNTKIRFLKGRAANPLSIAGQMIIKFPTAGRKSDFGTTGVVDVGFRAIASKTFTPLTAHINLGYFFIGNPPNKDLSDRIHYALGLEFELPESPVKMIAEIFGQSDVGSNGTGDLLSSIAGFSFHAQERLIFDISTGFGLASQSPDYVINGGASYFFH